MLLKNESIIIKPILTEKSNIERVEKKKYYFQVYINANKIQIVNALEKLFNVKVKTCNIIIVKGKKYKNRYHKTFYSAKKKKAIITLLKESPEFPFYENI